MNKKRVPGIKGKKAVDLLAEIMKDEGIHQQHIISIYHLVKGSVKKKRTIHEKSIFEDEVRKILKKFKDQWNNNCHLKVANEILELFYNDPNRKIRAYLKDNRDFISIIISLIALVLAIVNCFK